MKHQILITALLILSITTSGISQSVKLKHSLSFEIIPVSYMMTVGSGLNIQYAFESKKRFLSLVSAGFMYNNFNTGHEREFFTSNGVPLAKWSTEVDINTTRPYPLGGIVNSNDFQNLDKLGFKQFKAKMGYRLNRYLSYELLYKLSKRKLQFYAGGGITLGMTNSDETHVGFSGNIKNGANGLEERFWININIRAKYLYMGATAKLLLLYPINDNISVGISSGLHYIFDKDFREEVKIPYLGVLTKVSF